MTTSQIISFSALFIGACLILWWTIKDAEGIKTLFRMMVWLYTFGILFGISFAYILESNEKTATDKQNKVEHYQLLYTDSIYIKTTQ